MKRHFTADMEKELQELQEYFINSRESAIKLMRLQALVLLSRSEDARSLVEVREEARTILNIIKG